MHCDSLLALWNEPPLHPTPFLLEGDYTSLLDTHERGLHANLNIQKKQAVWHIATHTVPIDKCPPNIGSGIWPIIANHS